MHEVLVNRLGGLSLPRKSVVRLTDRPDMTLDVYRGRKTTKQQTNEIPRDVQGLQWVSCYKDFVVVLLFYVHGKHLRSCYKEDRASWSMVCPPVRSIFHSLKLVDYLSVEVDNRGTSSTYFLYYV